MSEWRLPTIEELLTLANDTKTKQASIDPEMESNYYWSGTTTKSYASYAWIVDFVKKCDGNGDGWGDKTDSYYVRCVKDIPNGLKWSETSDEKMNWQEAMSYAKNMNKEAT